jgi:hypothetical protein
MGKVRFIRVRGRIVPIRDKGASTRPKPQSDVAGKVKAAVAGVAVGAAAFYLLRRFRLSKNIKLANLQTAVETHGMGMASEAPRMPNAVTKFFEHVQGMKADRPELRGSVILNRLPGSAQHYFPVHTINPMRITDVLANKRNVTKIVNPAAMPATMRLDKALDKVGWHPSKLKDIYPKFLIKDDLSAMSKVTDFVTEKTAHLKRSVPQMERAYSSIIQERLPLTGEYRAHFLNGEVFGITHRRIPHEGLRNLWDKMTGKINLGGGGGAFVPVLHPGERKRITELLQKNVSMSRLRSNESMFAAFDIAKTQNGLKILEANTTPGTFINPFINRRFKELATGRMSRAKAGLGALAVGGGTYKLTAPSERRKAQ